MNVQNVTANEAARRKNTRIFSASTLVKDTGENGQIVYTRNRYLIHSYNKLIFSIISHTQNLTLIPVVTLSQQHVEVTDNSITSRRRSNCHCFALVSGFLRA